MKRQIRRGVFETNSSSTHSLTIVDEKDYDRWCDGEVLLFTGYGYGYPKDNKPLENHFYTKEEAIAFEKSSKYAPSEDFDWNDDEAVMELLHDHEWYDEEYWSDYYGEYYELFERSYTTHNNDTVVAFGYFGYDC